MIEWSLRRSADAVSIVKIIVASPVRTRSRSDGSVVPLPQGGSAMCCSKYSNSLTVSQ